MRLKQLTTVFLVENALRSRDDFIHLHELMRMTGRNNCQVSAALCHLRKHHRADHVGLEWFLLPTDDRCCTVEEKTPENKPRRSKHADLR